MGVVCGIIRHVRQADIPFIFERAEQIPVALPALHPVLLDDVEVFELAVEKGRCKFVGQE